tara:strand:+ start:614 stop:1114 length:501 start_codon:yes stop_codon:yes gene_type:complete
MRHGIHNIYFLILFFFFSLGALNSEESINLRDLQPSFEEEVDFQDSDSKTNENSKIKSKQKENLKTNEIIVKLRALDKITAKTSDIDIVLGNKKRFGYLEIFPKRCARSKSKSEKGVAAYLQVKDLSDKKDDKVFVFNGWTFSSSPTLRTFDHPVYDLWLKGCENI